jgi:enamine deaminase RidA (YjgF/YER057c/UK114 family)
MQGVILKTGINPGWPHAAKLTYSPGVVCDGWLYVSGLVATGPNHTMLCPDDLLGQAGVVLERLGEVLREAGCDYGDVVVTREYIVSKEGYKGTADLRRRFFSEPFPAATGVIVAGLLQPGALFELEAVARVPGSQR